MAIGLNPSRMRHAFLLPRKRINVLVVCSPSPDVGLVLPRSLRRLPSALCTSRKARLSNFFLEVVPGLATRAALFALHPVEHHSWPPDFDGVAILNARHTSAQVIELVYFRVVTSRSRVKA